MSIPARLDPPSVRTEAVLRLESPRPSAPTADHGPGPDVGSDKDSINPASPDVDLSEYRQDFRLYNLPCLNGTLVARHLLGVGGGANVQDLCSVTALPDRPGALIRAIERAYDPGSPDVGQGVPASGSSGSRGQDRVPSTSPCGPPAVVVLELPIDKQRAADAEALPNPLPDPAALAFPPSWLPALGRSLLFLDLSGSKRLDPAAWDLSLLADLPRLAMLTLRDATLDSLLPLDLPGRLPSLSVLDLHGARFRVPAEQLVAMLVGLSEASCGPGAGGGPSGCSGGSRPQQLVLATEKSVPEPAAARERGPRMRRGTYGRPNFDERKATEDGLDVYSLPATPPDAAGGAEPGAEASAAGGGGAGSQQGAAADKQEWVRMTDAVALRAVRAARERAFLTAARGMWWELRVRDAKSVDNAGVLGLSLPLDASMVRLVHELGLLPEESQAGLEGGGSKEGKDGKDGATQGQDAAGEEERGKQYMITERRSTGSGPRIEDVRLSLAWPYVSNRLDAPTWSRTQGWQSTFRSTYWLHLTSRQWQEWMAVLAPAGAETLSHLPQQHVSGAAAALAGVLGAFHYHHEADGAGEAVAAAAAQLGDPFEVELLPIEAFELRDRLAAGALHAAGTGCVLGLISGGRRFTTSNTTSYSRAASKDDEWDKGAQARPSAEASVHAPTPASLAARSLARRMLVAALLGPQKRPGETGPPRMSLAAVSPAARGSVSTSMLLVATRLEARLFGRVRRVSILPLGHPARASTHAARYWASVHAACDTLFTDPRVRAGVLTGAVPLAAVAELPAVELRSLVGKMRDGKGGAKAVSKGAEAEAGAGGLLAERAAAAADAADVEALQKQVSAGGQLDVQVPIFVEDWMPSQSSVDNLCAWHIADPRVWPHGSLLHGAVARGQLRCVAWLLERGLDLNGRISCWDLTSVHLCCMRPCLWRCEEHLLTLFRIPAAVIPTADDAGTGASPVADGNDDDRDSTGYDDEYENDNGVELARAFDKGLGLARGTFRDKTSLLFPGVCYKRVADAGAFTMLSPLWHSPDDDVTPSEIDQVIRDTTAGTGSHVRMQQPHIRSLPCTAAMPSPAAASAAPATAAAGAAQDTAGFTREQLLAAASPVLRLLLARGPDLTTRSWCGLQPLHYAAATCGPEAVVALLEAGADLDTPLPGTLVRPLHLLAHRAGRRWSGLSPRIAARLLGCRPAVPAAVVLGSMDEWGNCPLLWLLTAVTGPHGMPPALLGPLLEGLRAALPGGGGGGAGGGRRLSGGGGGRPSGLPREVVEGAAKALVYAMWTVQVEAARLILRHFPETASVHLPPLNATPLHVACALLAWGDVGHGHVLRCLATGQPLARSAGDSRQGFLAPKPPYIPAGAAALAGAVPAGDKAAAVGPGGESSKAASGQLLVLRSYSMGEGPQSKQGRGDDGDAGDGITAEEHLKNFWPYPLINNGPPHKESEGESASAAMQRYAAAQLRFAELLLAAGAPVDARDVAGFTPLTVAALCGTAPLAGLLLAKGASPTACSKKLDLGGEPLTRRRLDRVAYSSGYQAVGLNYLLLVPPPGAPASAPCTVTAGTGSDEEGGRECESGSRRGSEAGSAGEQDGGGAPSDGLPDNAWSAWERKFRRRIELSQMTFQLTPLNAAVIRSMQYITCESASTPESRSSLGKTVDGGAPYFKLDFNNNNGRANLSMFGDGILWQLLHHGPPALREAVLLPLRHTDTESLVAFMPRVALYVVADAMPGHPYVKYAERAAREACNALSPFTTTSLDAAVQKALMLALDAARAKREEGERRPSAKQKSKSRNGRGTAAAAGDGTVEVEGGGGRSLAPGRRRGAAWGPYEDEVLYDLMLTGVYPLFVSPEITNGESSILRMSTQLLHFANNIRVARRALLQAHGQQFAAASSSPASAGGPAASADALIPLENSETLLVDTFSIACATSQQRARVVPQGQAGAQGRPAASSAASGPSGASAGGAAGGGGGGDLSSVLVFHTQDDLEYGMTYARVAEVLPPVTSMRAAFGHGALLPDTVLRILADTMFKFVRTLCHISQRDLDWVKLPNGVTTAAVDGLFLPALPGDPEWNVTDLFRPRNFGFRLSFSYTRRYFTIELHAMTLMRTVPIDIREPAVMDKGPARAGSSAQAPAGSTAADGAEAGGSGPGGARRRAPARSAVDGRSGRVGAAPVDHSQVDEFKRWMRNPDVVRMEQVQSMAGRLEDIAAQVGGNWRQMPVPPVWWITGWVDRFLRLFLLGAISQEGDTMKKVKLHTLYDDQALDPWSRHEDEGGKASAGVAVPWSRLETNVLASLLSLAPLSFGDADVGDLAGRRLRRKDIERMRKVLETPRAQGIAAMNADKDNTDRGCIIFTAQWNKLAEKMNWPSRSTLEVQDVISRITRMSSCSYSTTWEASLQSMLSLLMSCDVSAELRREVEAKLLSLAADSALARRLVWGMCRGRRSEARTVALLSGVLEFQPLLLEALREHEEQAGALSLWHQPDHFWAVAGGPALAALEPAELAAMLQEQHALKELPLVLVCGDGAAAAPAAVAAAAATGAGAPEARPGSAGGAFAALGASASVRVGAEGAPSGRGDKLLYVCFRSREELQRAVAQPLLAGGKAAGADRQADPAAGSVVALLPITLWEAAAVASSALPRREDAVALPFFSLVFSRLPRGLRRADPHAAGSLWGAGLPAVLLCRRPAAHRWSSWTRDDDRAASNVVEEAGVVGTLFAAHAATPLPREWLRELDVSGDGEVSYREFLLAYLRHRAGDFLGPRTADDAPGREAEPASVPGHADAEGRPEGSGPSLAAQRWRRAGKAVQNQLSQAFFDQANALRTLREQEAEAQEVVKQEAWLAAEAKHKSLGHGASVRVAAEPAQAGGGGGLAAVRHFGARALDALGGGDGFGGAASSSWLPSVNLAGLDCVSVAELSEVQRCAWVAYANLRSAARYMKAAAAAGSLRAAPSAADAGPQSALLDELSGATAERAALRALMRCVKEPVALHGAPPGREAVARAQSLPAGAVSGSGTSGDGLGSGGAGDVTPSWLDALSGVATPAVPGGAASDGGQDASTRAPAAHPRDCALLELLLDLSAGAGPRAVHSDPLLEGLERPVGPLPGAHPLLLGRTLAAAGAQLGADAALELASGPGALANATAVGAAQRDGLAAPLGGCDEVFAASALRLAAEEVWGFVTDMQALVDRVVSPLVAAADQSVPIIQRDSITTIFGDTNIELILEYETDLLKLLTRQWRVAAPAAVVAPTVAGPGTHTFAAGQRKTAGARLRAYGGEFAPGAEALGLDPLSAGCQLRAVLTDPGVAGEVLELLQRLATAYQNYVNRVEAALRELRLCLERDSKGTFTALLKRFARPVKPRKERPKAAGATTGAAAAEASADGRKGEEDEEDDEGQDEEDEEEEQPKGKGGGKGSGGPAVRLEYAVHHTVRPLLSVRQLARYGPGAELEACLRKPAAHLATLAFLASICRSISAAQEALPELQASSPDAAVAAGEAAGGMVAAKTGAAQARGPAAQPGPAAVAGPVRRLLMRLSGLQVTKVLPLGEGIHPLFQAFCHNPVAGGGAGPGAVAACGSSGAEHSVVLRGVGAAVMAEEAGEGGDAGGGRGRGKRAARTLGERLDAWMEDKLLSGGLASRVLLAACTALVCLTWRVVPLLSERKTYLRELHSAQNMRLHRQLALSLERAINVRPADDEALEAELAEFHAAFDKAVREAENEMDLDEGDVKKASPMNLDAGFWDTRAPARQRDLEPLRQALREAEARHLHSTWAGARLMSNARRCAARMAATARPADKGKGGGGAKGKAGGGAGGGGEAGLGSGSESEGDEADRVVDSAVAAKKKENDKKSGKQKEKEKEGGDKADAGPKAAKPGGAGALAAALGAFGSKRTAAGGGGGEGAIRAAWPAKGGMAAAVAAARRAKEFAAVLKRAVRRREHARRRWDKTLYLVMQSGSMDEGLLHRESEAAVAALRRGAALSAWRQLVGVGDDLLMVFGAVAFRDVGRRFAPLMAAFLGGFPFVVLGVALQLRPDSRSGRLLMGGLVGGYCLFGFVAMASAVAQLRRDPSQLKVYRPSDTIRFPNFRKGTALSSWKAHWVNVFALVTLLLEFWQLCAFSYQRRIPYPKESFLKAIFPWALLDLGPAAYFLQVFALLVLMVVWIAVFFPQTPPGLKKVIMPFLGQAAYLTVTAGLLSQLNCRLDDGALVRNPDIGCWTDPRHLYGAVAALLALGLYVPRATLTPFEVFFSNANLDVKYRGLYVRMVQIIRLGMAGYNLYFADSFPFTVMVANGIGGRWRV